MKGLRLLDAVFLFLALLPNLIPAADPATKSCGHLYRLELLADQCRKDLGDTSLKVPDQKCP